MEVLDIPTEGSLDGTLRIEEQIDRDAGFKVQVVLYELTGFVPDHIGDLSICIVGIVAAWSHGAEQSEASTIFNLQVVVEMVLVREIERIFPVEFIGEIL